MTFTYTNDPSTSALDEVRFYLGDVDESDQLLQDEEINFYITKLTNVYNSLLATASYLADVIAGRFAREISISADGVTAGANELQQKYEELAKNLRRQWHEIGGVDGKPDVGGILWGEQLDWSVKPLAVGEGFMDNYRAGQQEYGGRSPNNWPGVLDDGWSYDY